MKVVIMAGGKGTRINSLFPDIPKPMIQIQNKPILEWEIEKLKEQGFTDIIITVSYMNKAITDYFGDGSRFGTNIEYYVENVPLGNAGALLKLDLKGDFLLLNADAVFDVDFNRLVDFHKGKGGFATILTHPNSHPYDSGLVITGNDDEVIEWLSKEDKRPCWYKNRVNSGIHILNLEAVKQSGILSILDHKSEKKAITVDLDRDILKPLCGTGRLYSYNSPEYIKDMGTPERFQSVCIDFEKGIVRQKNLRNKQKAVFLDRDGTINKYIGFLKNIDDFVLISGVSEAIRLLNENGYLVIVVTNQPVIARGEVTVDELNNIHNKMETLLGNEGAYIDAIYYCPHHPDKGYVGEVEELKIDCDCRKPKPGMLVQAAQDYNIDLSESWMVGDAYNDIAAGKAAGCNTALIGEKEFGQDIKSASLYEFVRSFLLK